MDVELESLCLETIFGALPRAVRSGKLFVNASATLLRHPIFLNPRNLTAINKSHPDVVLEISEKEVVGDWGTFRAILEIVRKANFKIAIDDAIPATGARDDLEPQARLHQDRRLLVHHLETTPSSGRSSRARLHRPPHPGPSSPRGSSEEEDTPARLGIEYGRALLGGRRSRPPRAGATALPSAGRNELRVEVESPE
jgi:hypothetical protein